MPAGIRSYLLAGAALAGAGVVTAAQILPSTQAADAQVVQSAVRLAAAVGTGDGQPCTGYHTSGCDVWATPTYTPVAAKSGSAANIPANLVNAVLNMPRAWVDAMNDFSYSLEVTGNWWVYSPTNVLGFDPADPPKIAALTNWFIPFPALSNPLGEHTVWWARANLPMDASCTGTVGPACSDIGPILGKMFLAPAWTLASGYQFPEMRNPVSDAEGVIGEEIAGSEGELAPWSGSTVKLDPNDPITSVMNYLTADPSTNAPKPLTGQEITAAFKRLGKALNLAFNPIVPNSYLLKGWPYTALTPLFLPFVPAVCPTCNPDNPGGPPITPAVTPAAAVSPDAASATPQDAPSEGPGEGAGPGRGPATGDSGEDAAPGQAAKGKAESARAASRHSRSASAKASPAVAAARDDASAPVAEGDEPGGPAAEAADASATAAAADAESADAEAADAAAAATADAEAADARAAAEAVDAKPGAEAADGGAADAKPAATAGKHRKAEPSGRSGRGQAARGSAGAGSADAGGSAE